MRQIERSMKVSEAARLAALLNARLVARPGRIELEAVAVPGMFIPAQAARPVNANRFGD